VYQDFCGKECYLKLDEKHNFAAKVKIEKIMVFLDKMNIPTCYCLWYEYYGITMGQILIWIIFSGGLW
jgi:hypothetical protein